MRAPTTALVLMIAWFLVAFVLRGVLQHRRTGDHGFRLGSDALFSVHWWGRVTFAVALVLSALAPVLALGADRGLAAPLPALDHGALVALGLALAGPGVLATFVAQLAMGEDWRVGVDPEEATGLVADGLYASVRNPIYTAMLATSLGLTLLVPSPLGIGALVVLLLALEVQVRWVEEPHLRRLHGAAYERYAARAGRFLPVVGRARA